MNSRALNSLHGNPAPKIERLWSWQLDPFNRINNVCSYAVDDLLLQHFVDVVRRIATDNVEVFYLGGDFCVI